MSELKAFYVGLGRYSKDGSRCVVALATGRTPRALNGKIYLKSEADKVIAELKSDIADLRDDKKLTDAILDERNAEIVELKKACNDKDDWCLHTLKENRHQKYKRCLAMAKLAVKDDYAPWNMKWHKRWLALAKEPTWAKFLQLIRKEAK